MASLTAALPLRLRGRPPWVVTAALAAPLVLLVARALPEDGLGLALRLGAAAACVLLVPGVLILRALGWPDVPALAISAAVALSLGVAFVAFALTFAVGGTLVLTVGIIALAVALAVVPALRAKAVPTERVEWIVLGAVLAGALAFAGLVWWATQTVGTGDALMHLARSRKIAEADVLSSVDVANEYRDGGLHPGYAFPLWHGVVALVARLAGVDVGTTTLHLSALLVPLAFVAAYAAGRVLFGSWAGGVATLVAQVAQLGFSRGGIGSFDSLSLPASTTRILLVPILLALAFACLRPGSDRRLLIPLAAASLAVAVVHPTYVIFAAIPLAVFLAVWIAVSAARRATATTAALTLAAIVVPAIVFFLWLLPVVTSTASHAPTAGEEARAIAHYGDQLQVVGDGYRAAPEAITRAGPVVVAGLAALVVLVLALRRAWALFALSGTMVILAILLVPELFTRFSDLVSISQSRRLVQFVPIPFAIAGAAVVIGRLRLAGAALALGLGIALEVAYSAEISHEVERGGPTWPIWVAFASGAAGLLVAVFARRRLPAFEPNRWTAIAATAFLLPVAVAGLAEVERAEAADPYGLTPGVVAALERLDDGDVVLAPVQTSYRVAAFANVYVAATPPPHAADTDENRPYERQRDVIRFFSPQASLTDDERRRTLDEYGAAWILVDKRASVPRAFLSAFESVYEDGRYELRRGERP